MTADRDFSDDLATDWSEALAVLEQEQLSLGLGHSAAVDCHETLEQLLTGVRWLVPADGASLYLRRGSTLRLSVVQNDTLSAKLGEGEMLRRLQGLQLPVSSSSIAGHVALTGEVINVPDLDHMAKDSRFKFCPAIDRQMYGYRSLLTAPIINDVGTMVGVVQLINALDDDGRPVPFGPDGEAIVRKFTAQAARVIYGRPSNGRFSSLS